MKGNRASLKDLFAKMELDTGKTIDTAKLMKQFPTDQNGKVLLANIKDGAADCSAAVKESFMIGTQEIGVCWASPEAIRESGHGVAQVKNDGFKDRFSKVKEHFQQQSGELNVLESVSTATPLWQVQSQNGVNWDLINDRIAASAQAWPFSRCFINVSADELSVEWILSQVLRMTLASDHRVTIIAASSGSPALLLPLVYVVNAVNKLKVRLESVDLLLANRACEKTLEVLRGFNDEKQLAWIGEPISIPGSVQVPIYGAFHQNPRTQTNYILDSSGDIPTSVGAIASDVWCSGVKVNHRLRPLLFVHEPVYDEVVALLATEINKLETSADITAKSARFILRSCAVGEKLKACAAHGKVVSGKAQDCRGPTVVYNIGTSSDLVASPPKNSGHVLVVIPYRNTAEILSLANNVDLNKQVNLFTSNVALMKQVSVGLKAKIVSINSCKSESAQAVLPLSVLSSSKALSILRISLSAAADKGVKAGASWRALDVFQRSEFVERLLSSLIPNKVDLAEGEMRQLVMEVMRIVGTANTGHQSGNSLVSEKREPVGLVALVYNVLQLEKSVLVPLVAALLSGNTVILLSASETLFSDVPFGNLVPAGVVNLETCPLVPDAIASCASLGKIHTLWVVDNLDESGLSLDSTIYEAFQRILVSGSGLHGNLSLKPVLKLAKYLQDVKVIKV